MSRLNPFAKSHVRKTLPQCHHDAELENKCAYDMRVREVEHGTLFSPLVFLLSKVSGKQPQLYTNVLC